MAKKGICILTAVSFVMLSFGGQAFGHGHGHGKVVSFYFDGNISSRTPVVISLLENGFVMTDLVFSINVTPRILIQEDDGVGSPSTRLMRTNEFGNKLHFNSGISFGAGSLLTISLWENPTSTSEITELVRLTISGYIPTVTPQGNVPAVSTWGIVVMAMLLLSAGTLVVMRRKLQFFS